MYSPMGASNAMMAMKQNNYNEQKRKRTIVSYLVDEPGNQNPKKRKKKKMEQNSQVKSRSLK
jgi:hypothetical protein